MVQQLAADTGPAYVGIDEERLHVRSIDEHEAMGLIGFVDSNSHWRMGQETTHFSVNCLSVFGTQKMMSGIHGAPPEINESFTIFRT